MELYNPEMLTEKNLILWTNTFTYCSRTYELYCTKCQKIMKMDTTYRPYCSDHGIESDSTFSYNCNGKSIKEYNLPVIFKSTCKQCGSKITTILYLGPSGKYEFINIYSSYSGSYTTYTPDEIKYYLDQAFKCKNIGAYTAAMAMYRSAIEWIMEKEGYSKGMLGKRIDNLENDILNGRAPKWTDDVSPEELEVLKNLGNTSMHTNHGDISLQQKFDTYLLNDVDLVIQHILEEIYDKPIKKAERLKKLKTLSYTNK